jgi:hypothetical protein
MFPASGSLLAAPPFPRSGPGEPGSPTSAVLRRRYDFPLTNLPVTYWFRSRAPRDPPGVRARCCQRSRTGGGAVAGQDHWSAGDPHCRRFARGREWDLSGFQTIHPVPLPRSKTPAGPLSPRHYGLLGAAPAQKKAKAPACVDIEAYRGALAPAVYASRATLPSPMQDSLPAGWLASTGRELNPLDRDERFPIATSLPPFLDLS